MSPETQVPFPEDATHTEELFFSSGRNAALSELTVEFQAQAEPGNWHQVVTKLDHRFIEGLKLGGASRINFYALPNNLERLRPFLTASVTLNDASPGLATWDFTWSRAHDDSPPDVVVKSSQAVGGFPNVLERLGAVWPVTSTVEAQISARYIILGNHWRFTLASGQAKRVVSGERIHEVRPTRWTISPPSGCVTEVSQQVSGASPTGYILGGQGTYSLRWTPHFLNEVDGAIWDGLKIFLKARRSAPKR